MPGDIPSRTVAHSRRVDSPSHKAGHSRRVDSPSHKAGHSRHGDSPSMAGRMPPISVISWTVSVRVAIVGGVVAVGGVAVGWIPIPIAIVGRCCGCANQPARDEARCQRAAAPAPTAPAPAVSAPAIAAPAITAPAEPAPPDLFAQGGTRDGVCGSYRDRHRFCLDNARARERRAERGGGEKPLRDHTHDPPPKLAQVQGLANRPPPFRPGPMTWPGSFLSNLDS